MKKNNLLLLSVMFVMVLALAACGSSGSSTSEEPAEGTTQAAGGASAEEATKAADESSDSVDDGSEYGYAGTDPVEAAVYKYMVKEVSKNYDKADVAIPVVTIVHTDDTDQKDIVVYGDFWINNYNIKGDTLECVSGGNYPGVLHVKKDGDAYIVSGAEFAADGEDFDKSAKELFGDHYDAFMKVYSDSDAREALRKKIVSDYVKLNGLKVSKYQDYGWDPVDLDK